MNVRRKGTYTLQMVTVCCCFIFNRFLFTPQSTSTIGDPLKQIWKTLFGMHAVLVLVDNVCKCCTFIIIILYIQVSNLTFKHP